MTPSQLSAIRARLDAATPGAWSVAFVTLTAPDLRALLDEVERLKNDLAMARQVSGELCQACGWAMKFPGEPCRCELLRWRDEWASFKARTMEQGASAFARGAEAMREAAAQKIERDCGNAQTVANWIRDLPIPEDR